MPENIALDKGIVDAFISNQGQSIRFTGEGEETNVGTRIDSPTMGMSVDGAAPKGHAYARKVYPKHSVSRTAIAEDATEPFRGKTMVSGINRPKIAEDTRKILEGTYVEPAPVEPTPKPVKPRPKDDISDLTTLTEADLDELSGVSEEDIWGEPRQQPRNRVKLTERQPIRGRQENTPTTVRQVRS